MADVIEPYLEGYKLSHRPQSILFAKGRLAQVKRVLGYVVLSDLTDERVRAYIRQRQCEEISGRTIYMEVGEFSSPRWVVIRKDGLGWCGPLR